MNQLANNTAFKARPLGKDLSVAVIGTGLIGGSMAIALKEKGFAAKIIGVESNPEHQRQALDLGLVDEINELDEAIRKSGFIIVSVPVSVADDLIISMIAEAKDTDGKISKVQFYNGTTLLVTEKYWPYTYTWNNVPEGNYELTAKATDDKGLSATSEIIYVSVKALNNSFVSAGGSNGTSNTPNGALIVKVAPNPAGKILNINIPGIEKNKKLNISVVAVSGVVIKTIGTTSNEIMQMDVSSLRPGVYFLKVLSGDKVLYTRFVKL